MRLIREHRETVAQIVRFGITGVLLTLLVGAAYWLLAELAGIEPMVAMTISYLAVTALGYVLHSRFSFKGHGARDNQGARTVRFFVVNTSGFLANQFFVWLLVHQMGGPTWWPIIPVTFVTPVLTFSLNRKWVFA
jgi:putative flippase GtrA